MAFSPPERRIQLEVRRILKADFIDADGGNRPPSTVASRAMPSAMEPRTNPEARSLRALSAESVKGRILIRFFPPAWNGLPRLIMAEVPAVRILSVRGSWALPGVKARSCSGLLGKTRCRDCRDHGYGSSDRQQARRESPKEIGGPNRTLAASLPSRWLQRDSS